MWMIAGTILIDPIRPAEIMLLITEHPVTALEILRVRSVGRVSETPKQRDTLSPERHAPLSVEDAIEEVLVVEQETVVSHEVLDNTED